MSKRMSKFLTYWTLLVLVQIYVLAIYQYGEIYGFDDQIVDFTRSFQPFHKHVSTFSTVNQAVKL